MPIDGSLPCLVTRSNRQVGSLGGYFFFVSRMISKIRLTRLTIKVQNWNKSENVTTPSPPFRKRTGGKKLHPLINEGRKPPTVFRQRPGSIESLSYYQRFWWLSTAYKPLPVGFVFQRAGVFAVLFDYFTSQVTISPVFSLMTTSAVPNCSMTPASAALVAGVLDMERSAFSFSSMVVQPSIS